MPLSSFPILRDRRVWLILVLLVAFAALRLSGIGAYLSFETLGTHRDALTSWVASHPALAGLIYVGLYTAVVAFSVPGAFVLTLAGGFLFGAVWGTFYAVLGATIGATLVFLLATSIFGDKALDRLGPQALRLADAIRRHAAPYLLTLRLVPLFPFVLVNLVPAFVGVPLVTYVATTFLGIIPGTAVFALAGAGLGSVLDQGEEVSVGSILTPEIMAGLIGLGALSLLAIPLRRKFGSPE